MIKSAEAIGQEFAMRFGCSNCASAIQKRGAEMNNSRRKTLREIAGQLSAAREELEAVRDEEQEFFDNMPESLQGGEKGERAQAAIDSLESAITSMEEAENEIESACA